MCNVLQIPLCGYGGVSNLTILGTTNSPDGRQGLDMGEVKGQQGIKLKISIHNSGPRAGFMQVAAYKLDGSAPLSTERAQLVPSCLVVPQHSSAELQLYYRPDKSEEEKCKGQKSPLSLLVIQCGDEVMRQRLVMTTVSGDKSAAPVSSVNAKFVKEFSHQETVPSGKQGKSSLCNYSVCM